MRLLYQRCWFITLELWRVYLTYHIAKINIMNVSNIVQISRCRLKWINNISLHIIRLIQHKVALIAKQEYISNHGSTISVKGIPNPCLYSLVPNRIKMLSNKKVNVSHTFWHDHAWYFLGFSEVKKCISIITCKGRRAYSLEGSFNKINNFIFY